MGVTNSNKVINTGQIACDGSLRVTLALTAAPDIVSNPTDIVMVLDRSGSMVGAPLANLKLGAKTFIQLIDEATDGAQDGQIGSGSRMAVVSFSSLATADTQLTTSVSDLNQAVDALSAGGTTNHADAFAKATELFDPASGNAKVLVMFTDGNTTAGAPPAPVAAAARAQGIVIYCIGLIGSDGLDVDALNDWATDPDASHVAVTPDAADLEALFAELAANISKPGATNIVLDEILTPDFVITSILSPTKGTADQLDAHGLRWKIPQLGVTGSESATLDFFVRHIGSTQGRKLVNQSITYSDTEGNKVSFPDPSVLVKCDVVVCPEPCPDPIDITVEGCSDGSVVDLGELDLTSQGQILQLNVMLKKVCPGKRVALAALLTETGCDGKEYPRGMKTMTIPAHHAPDCRDVQVKCIRFVIPGDLTLSCCSRCGCWPTASTGISAAANPSLPSERNKKPPAALSCERRGRLFCLFHVTACSG